MLNQYYLDMTKKESVIRQIFMYGRKRAEVIGYENVFDYSLGNPSVPTPEAFTNGLIELLQTREPVALHGYSPNMGLDSTRDAIAQSLNKRFGTKYTAMNIFPVSGAAGALAHAMRAIITPGEDEEILTCAPYFPEYGPYVIGVGAKLVVVPADPTSFQVNFKALEELINEKTRALLINSPNNPSGIVYTTETIDRLAEILTRKSEEYGRTIYLISDEPYRELVFAGVDSPFIANHYAHTMVCYSFSKSVSLPGERIGYVAVNSECDGFPDLVPVFAQISRFIGHNCPASLMQLGIEKILYETSDLSIYETNKNILYKELTAMGFDIVEPGGTFYMFPKSLEPDDVAFCQKAKEFDLLLVPGSGFGCPGHFRIAYCIQTEKVERSLEAFRKLAALYR